MQKTKTITIREKTFTLKELPVKVVWDLVNTDDEDKKEKPNIMDQGRELLALACPELTFDALIQLYPSEIEDLWKGFEEVNAAFLAVARKIGMGEVIVGTVRGAVMSLTRQSVFLSQRATGRKPGNTDSGFFSRLWKH